MRSVDYKKCKAEFAKQDDIDMLLLKIQILERELGKLKDFIMPEGYDGIEE